MLGVEVADRDGCDCQPALHSGVRHRWRPGDAIGPSCRDAAIDMRMQNSKATALRASNMQVTMQLLFALNLAYILDLYLSPENPLHPPTMASAAFISNSLIYILKNDPFTIEVRRHSTKSGWR